MSERGLTTKQALFVEHYLGAAKSNATEAARLAGYRGSEGTLRSIGSENLTKPNIASRVGARVDEAAMTADEVLAELADIGRADWREFVQIQHDREGNVIDATLLLKDKLRALELIGKAHGIFSERVIHQGDQNAPPITVIEVVRPEGV